LFDSDRTNAIGEKSPDLVFIKIPNVLNLLVMLPGGIIMDVSGGRYRKNVWRFILFFGSVAGIAAEMALSRVRQTP